MDTNEQRPNVSVTNTTAAELIPSVLGHLVEANREHPRLFAQREGVIVRLRDNGRGRLEAVSRDALALELDRIIMFTKHTHDSYVKVAPPSDVVAGILAADHYEDFPELPALRRVAEAPFFTKDGALVMEPGYHAQARTYLRLPESLRNMTAVPEQPSKADVAGARKWLVDELLVDFPFASPAARAHALAILIVPFVRELIDGLVPLAAIVAPTPGTGKGKLANVISLVATGAPIEVMSATIPTAEREKRVTALLMEGAAFALFDNAVGLLDDPGLAALGTAEVWKGRILGVSKTVAFPNITQWIITGNALEFTGEIARRCLAIALDAKMEEPFRREAFKHNPLEKWIKENRTELVRSVLVLVQHWIAEGRPEFTARALGSYEKFVRIVGGILGAAALDDGFLTPTLETGAEVSVADADTELRRLVRRWNRTHGFKVVGAAELLDAAPKELLTSSKEHGRLVQLGTFLQKNAGRTVFDKDAKESLKIVSQPFKDEQGRDRNKWKLEPVK